MVFYRLGKSAIASQIWLFTNWNSGVPEFRGDEKVMLLMQTL